VQEKDKVVQDLSRKEQDLQASLREKQKAAQKLEQEISKLITADIKAAADRAKRTYVRNSKTNMKTGSTEILLTNDEQVYRAPLLPIKGNYPGLRNTV